MIKKYKKPLIASSAAILLPMVMGLLLWKRLPESMTMHWGADGTPDGWGPKTMVVFGLPLIMLAMQWVCLWITGTDPGNRNQSEKVIRMVIWILPILSLMASGVILSVAMNISWGGESIPPILIGAMFVVIGNYLPKCRQNTTVGIKVTWALANEENWNATHRFGGKVWFIAGLLMMVCVFLPSKAALAVMLTGVIAAAVVPVVYSWLYYRKQVQAGEAPEKPVVPLSRSMKIASAVGVSVAVVIAAVAGIVCFTGNISVVYGADAFSIEADYWSDLTIPYEDVESVEYRTDAEPGERIIGFGSPRLQMGDFQSEELGSYTRYTYTQCDACVVIMVRGKILVVSGPDDSSTASIYDAIRGRVGMK